jgi:cell wall-associated NlpC family hydrolase
MTKSTSPRALAFARILAIALLIAAVLLGSAGTSDAQRRPRPDRVRSVLRAARNAIGVRYQYGGDSMREGFDCSGLTRWAWQHGGDNLPHNSRQQYDVVRHVGRRYLRPGDLLFFYSPIHHVAVYVGNGFMIEAPHSGARVRRVHVYWQFFTGARRPA